MRTESRFTDFDISFNDKNYKFIFEVRILQIFKIFPWEILNKIHEYAILSDLHEQFKALYKTTLNFLEFNIANDRRQMSILIHGGFDNPYVYVELCEANAILKKLSRRCTFFAEHIEAYCAIAKRYYLSKDLIDTINAFDYNNWFFEIPNNVKENICMDLLDMTVTNNLYCVFNKISNETWTYRA